MNVKESIIFTVLKKYFQKNNPPWILNMSRRQNFENKAFFEIKEKENGRVEHGEKEGIEGGEKEGRRRAEGGRRREKEGRRMVKDGKGGEKGRARANLNE